MPKKKKPVTKKKTIKKTIKKVEKIEYHDSFEDGDDMMHFHEEHLDDVLYELRRMACIMVHVGLEMGPQTPEEIRLKHVMEIFTSEENVMSEEEMDNLAPYDEALHILKNYMRIEEGICSLSEQNYTEVCNKLSEQVVYRLLQHMEKEGLVKLCWDEEKKDFIYMPVDHDKGEDWKK